MKAVLAILLVVLGCAAAAAQDAKSPFVGVWNLTGIERHTPAGEVVPLNRPYSSGQIIYTATGRFALQFIRPDRPPFAGDEPTPQEALGAVKDYAARYGTFTVDGANRTITLHVENSLTPFAPENAELTYFYEIAGNQLKWFTAPRIIDEPGHRFNGTEIFQTYNFVRAD